MWYCWCFESGNFGAFILLTSIPSFLVSVNRCGLGEFGDSNYFVISGYVPLGQREWVDIKNRSRREYMQLSPQYLAYEKESEPDMVLISRLHLVSLLPKCPQKTGATAALPLIQESKSHDTKHKASIGTIILSCYPGNDLILWSLDGAHGTEAWLQWQTNVGKRHLGAEDNMEGTLGWTWLD